MFDLSGAYKNLICWIVGKIIHTHNFEIPVILNVLTINILGFALERVHEIFNVKCLVKGMCCVWMMCLRLWFSWLEVHWKWRGGPLVPGCRGFVLGLLSYQWSRSAQRTSDERRVSCRVCGVCPVWDVTCICPPGNQFPAAAGGGDRVACGRQRWTPASASSCKSFHNPVPVIELQGCDDIIKTQNKRKKEALPTLNISHSVQITSACALWQAS